MSEPVTSSEPAAAGTATLGERVAAVLEAFGLRGASRGPAGHPSGEGYAVEPMPQCGPERVAVRWHHDAPCPGCPALDLCRTALAAAGYRVETIHASVTYIAVLPRQAADARTLHRTEEPS